MKKFQLKIENWHKMDSVCTLEKMHFEPKIKKIRPVEAQMQLWRQADPAHHPGHVQDQPSGAEKWSNVVSELLLVQFS